jgi:hypothetical protein
VRGATARVARDIGGGEGQGQRRDQGTPARPRGRLETLSGPWGSDAENWALVGVARGRARAQRRCVKAPFQSSQPCFKGTNSKILNTSLESPNMKVVDDASEYNFYQG